MGTSRLFFVFVFVFVLALVCDVGCSSSVPGGGGTLGDGGVDAGADAGAAADAGADAGSSIDAGADADAGVDDGGADGGTFDGGMMFFDPCDAGALWSQFHGGPDHRGFASVAGPSSANIKWTFFVGTIPQPPPLDNSGRSPGSVAIDFDQTIYVAGPKLFALYPDGGVRWVFDAGSAGPAVSMFTNQIFFDTGSSTIAAVDRTGMEQWRTQLDGSVLFAPTASMDMTIYQSSWDGYVYALTLNGAIKWKFKTDTGCASYPPTVGFDGTVYVGGGDVHCGNDSHLYALYPDGGLRWKVDAGKAGGPDVQRVGSPALTFDGTLIVPAGPHLFAIDSFSGATRWVAYGVPNDTSGIITPAIGPDGTIYVGTSQGKLNAFAPDGGFKWSYQTGLGIDQGQQGMYGVIGFPVVDCRGTVYVGAVDGKMHAVASDGGLKWTIQTDAGFTESSPAFGGDGTLYFTSGDGFLYAVGP